MTTTTATTTTTVQDRPALVLVPLSDERASWDDLAIEKNLTCQNHQGARYYSKGAGRSIHLMESDPEVSRTAMLATGRHTAEQIQEMGEVIRFMGSECSCPTADLRVILG